jgi:hemerythrin
MSLMTWTAEQYGTNVDFADEEHRDVFKNINILYDIRMAGAGNPEIVEQLKGLLSILAAHFAHEEKEMLAKNFIGYQRHKIEHDELLDTCTAMEIKIEEGELELTERICQLIKSWFDSHIPEYDRAYTQALNS